MLLIGSRLIGTQVMSLQTGSALARTVEAVIDPAVLAVVAYRIEGSMFGRVGHYVRIDDVRELSDIGMIIDSADELVARGDVIKLDAVIELGFKLIGMLVMDETGKKLGKVVNYNLDTTSFKVDQLTVRRPFLSSLKDVELLVHRSQVIEINDRGIVIHSRAKAPEHTRVSTPGAYVNPFRKSSSAPQNGHAVSY